MPGRSTAAIEMTVPQPVPPSASPPCTIGVIFENCAKSYIAAQARGWKSGKHAKQWLSTLETYAFPVIGKRSTFRDWAAEVELFPSDIIEHPLAHKLKDEAEAAYQRGDLLLSGPMSWSVGLSSAMKLHRSCMTSQNSWSGRGWLASARVLRRHMGPTLFHDLGAPQSRNYRAPSR